MKASPHFRSKLKGNWLDNEQLAVWARQRGKENLAGYEHNIQDSIGPNHAYRPGFAYESGILPLLPLRVKGVIWYQGESNSQEAERVAEYGSLMHLLVDSYRSAWQNPDLSFYWVQLSSIDTAHYQSKYWPVFRDEQRKQIDSISRGGMAVSSDVGLKDNVHPTDKKVVGERLARWALKQDYGDGLVPSGPLAISARYKRDKVIIHFRYGKGLRTADGQAVRGFSIDGMNSESAVVHGDKIIIPATQKPTTIYYGWLSYTNANLINEEGLPASTFKIELP